ncbi:MAG: hypothetical protein ACMG51_09620 [Ginsengibacter sp.]
MNAWQKGKNHTFAITFEVEVSEGVTLADVAVMAQQEVDSMLPSNEGIVLTTRVLSVEEALNDEED